MMMPELTEKSGIPRLVIIGIDGATFDVLNPLMEEGHLINLRNLIQSGVHANLISTIPPVTGPAWTALATGLNPGKTGIIDFVNREDNDWRLKVITSHKIRNKTFWDYLSNAGAVTGIINYPMLFPPYPVNGFMVSGLGASAKDDITYPLSLKDELNEVTGGYKLLLNYNLKKYKNANRYVKDAFKFLSKQKLAINYLLNNQPLDIAVIVISVSDWIQHFFWKHWDSGHCLHDPAQSDKYRQHFIDLWDKIDELIGNIVETASGANFFVVSDHGFGAQDQCFNLSRWLIDQGYMVLRKNLNKNTRFALYKILSKLYPVVPDTIRELGRKAIEPLKSSVADIIDFDKSVAFCLGHSIPFGAIYIKNKNNSSDRYEALKNEIIGKLSVLGKLLNRTDVEVQCFPSKDIAFGTKLSLLPDIILTINQWRCVIEENDINRPLFEDKPYSSSHTGTHRINGIFVASGPQIVNNNTPLKNAHILDIFPTVLYTMGFPVPENDGRILNEIFKQKIDQENKFSTELKTRDQIPEIKPDDEKKIIDRLKGLGYL